MGNVYFGGIVILKRHEKKDVLIQSTTHVVILVDTGKVGQEGKN